MKTMNFKSPFPPHPDAERLTVAELTAAIEKADENMRRARELGDSEKETWSLQERRGLIAELKRREGWRPENIRKYEAADYGLDLPADASLDRKSVV